MSVVVKADDNKKYVFTKGADSSLLEMTSEPTDKLVEEVESLAAQGLRTLVFGYKELDSSIDTTNLSVEEAEKNLILLGVTGVEDLL